MSRSAAAPGMGALLFFALLAVTLIVAALVLRARTPDLALEVVDLSPRELTLAPGDTADARVSLFVRKGDPAAEITLVDAEGMVVRTLAAAAPLEPDRLETYRWDGRTDAGRPARTGRYRVRVVLPERDRDMVWPRPIILNRVAGDDDGRHGRDP